MLARIASHLSAGSSCAAHPSCYHSRQTSCRRTSSQTTKALAPGAALLEGSYSMSVIQRRDVSLSAASQPPLYKTDWRKDQLNDEENDEAFLKLTSEEIEDRIDEAAAMIAVIHDLRPSAVKGFNHCEEIWRRIRRVPPWERHRLLSELDPGSIRGLWKASMARYVLDDSRAIELAGGYTIWQDFPQKPDEVLTYMGKCEKYVITAPQIRFFVDEEMQKNRPRSTPWLRPAQGSVEIPAESFKMQFFVHPPTGELMGRVVFPLVGPLDRWWIPCYLRLKMELSLTPIKEDAGSDLTFEYPYPSSPDLNGWRSGAETELLPAHLPDRSWPDPEVPTADTCVGSPFSRTQRDFLRVAGPGVFVGCAYLERRDTTSGPAVFNEEDCVYFVIIRRSTKSEYIRQLIEEEDSDSDDETQNIDDKSNL